MTTNQSIKEIFQKIGKEVNKVSFLGKGEASIVFRIDTSDDIYVLKTALYPERKNKVLGEAKIRNSFIDKGLTFIPEPIYSDEDIFQNGAVVYRFVDGIKPDFEETDSIKQMAKIISSIHTIDYKEELNNIEKLTNFLENTIEKIKQKYPHLLNNATTLALDQAVLEFKQIISTSNIYQNQGIDAWLHGDLSDNFVIDTDKKIWLLDWENSEYGDIVEEISWFLSVNKLNLKQRSIFFEEYKHNFTLAKKLNLEELYQLYSASTPVFNICWGIDQLQMNITQNLEPERKIKDLIETANEWKDYYSEKISNKIIEGINKLSNGFHTSHK